MFGMVFRLVSLEGNGREYDGEGERERENVPKECCGCVRVV